jgi:hypothetical protein
MLKVKEKSCYDVGWGHRPTRGIGRTSTVPSRPVVRYSDGDLSRTFGNTYRYATQRLYVQNGNFSFCRINYI